MITAKHILQHWYQYIKTNYSVVLSSYLEQWKHFTILKNTSPPLLTITEKEIYSADKIFQQIKRSQCR